MGHGLPRSHRRGPYAAADQPMRAVTVRDVTMTVTAASGDGWATAVIGGLPQGNILFRGCVGYMQFAGSGSDADLSDTWAGDYSVGTTPTTDATLTGTDANVVPSTALAAATAEVSPRTRGVSTTSEAGAVLDNTDGSLELNLNLKIDDADVAGDDSVITVNGELFLDIVVLGDD